MAKKKKSKRKPIVLKIGNYQIGGSIFKKDIKYSAMSPGKRKSKNGNIYYEYRKNRTDKKGKKV